MGQNNKFGGPLLVPLDEHFGFGEDNVSTGPHIIAVDGDPTGLPAPTGSLALDYTTPGLWRAIDDLGSWVPAASGAGTGDVIGPTGPVTPNALAIFNGTSGKILREGVSATLDNTGKLKVNELQTGDLLMRSKDGTAYWRLIEQPDGIQAINEVTGQRFRLAMIPEDGDSSTTLPPKDGTS